jgi:hypothetical protein
MKRESITQGNLIIYHTYASQRINRDMKNYGVAITIIKNRFLKYKERV